MTARIASAFALALLLLYGLPLFAPPGAVYPTPPPVDADLWQRLFPQLPAWWVIGRLLCLAAGAAWIAWRLRGALPLRLPAARVAPAGHVPNDDRTAASVALLIAWIHAASGLWVAHFNRLAETLYFVALAVPAAVLALPEIRRLPRLPYGTRWRAMILLVVPILWLTVSVPTAWRSPRAANLVDMWIMVDRIDQVARGDQQILADSADPGHTNAYMMLEGAPLIGPVVSASLIGLQVTHLFWTAICGLLTGLVVWRMVGHAAAVVAQSVFLFSPWALSTAYNPGMNQIAPLCTLALFVLVLAVRELRSPAALAAFGAVVGFSTTEPTAYLTTFLLCLLMAYTVARMSPRPWLGMGVAALSFVAAALPGLPDLAALPRMVQQYTFGRGQLASMILILFGQDSVTKVSEALEIGNPGPFDVPLGALLSPFVIARMPMRLWGDTLVDPIGVALMAIGLCLCVLYLTRRRSALFVLALLAGALAHAFTSRGDAVSHARLVGALVPIALLAGVGFEAVRSRFMPRRSTTIAGAVVARAIAAAGTVLFVDVNPRILPASSPAITFEALGTDDPNADAVIVDYDTVDWLYIRYMAELLPSRPLAVIKYSELAHLEVTSEMAGKVFFWSPALEQDGRVGSLICERWPQSALYTLTDRTGLFRAIAASPGGDVWQPRLPPDRWQVTACDAGVPTG